MTVKDPVPAAARADSEFARLAYQIQGQVKPVVNIDEGEGENQLCCSERPRVVSQLVLVPALGLTLPTYLARFAS